MIILVFDLDEKAITKQWKNKQDSNNPSQLLQCKQKLGMVDPLFAQYVL